MRFPDIRVQLLDLAERYERLATRVGRAGFRRALARHTVHSN
jgi:hypothetical protein